MAFDFFRLDDGEQFSISNATWGRYLELAVGEGWEPQGTCKVNDEGDEDTDWGGAYDLNEGQMLSADDAENLFLALQRAVLNPLVDLSDDESRQLRQFISWGRIDQGGSALEAVGFEIY